MKQEFDTISKLVGDAIEQLGKLVQNETQLAKTELAQKATQLTTGIAYVVGAAVLSIPVLVLLLLALAQWLIQLGLTPAFAHLASAIGGAIASAILGAIGLSYLKPESLKPKVTMQQIRRDIEVTKELAR